MTFVPHLRLTMTGEIEGGKEQFSYGVSLAAVDVDPLTAWIVSGDATKDLVFDDMVADATRFHGDVLSFIAADAVLKRVKLVAIGADGKYAEAPREAAVNVPGGNGAHGPFPWQISCAVTIGTDGDLGRVKGRFYLPRPALAFTPADDTWNAAQVEQLRDSAAQFLEDLGNQPGPDWADIRPVVASQGRHNPDGSVRRPPTNHEAKRVLVGRRPDVQRRRANKVLEQYTAPADLNIV